MKKVIAFLRNLGYTEIPEQEIKRAYWRNAKQPGGIGPDPAYRVHDYLRTNKMI